jgi:hypothetical protein
VFPEPQKAALSVGLGTLVTKAAVPVSDATHRSYKYNIEIKNNSYKENK